MGMWSSLLLTLETFETDIIEVDPLVCPKCSGKMKIISVIDDEDIKKKILKHLGLWNSKPRPPPEPKDVSKKSETVIDDSFSQLPVLARHCSRSGEAGGSDNWLYVDPQYLSEA